MPTEIVTGTSRLTLPGLISANLHASRDGLRVVNYAQWESVEAWKAMMANQAAGEKREKIEGIAVPDVHQYDVVATYEGPAA